jgi:hypothetical protein
VDLEGQDAAQDDAGDARCVVRRLAICALLASGCWDFNALQKSPCLDPGAVCDDFETGLNMMTWTSFATPNSSVTVDGTHARGNMALHIHLSKTLPALAQFVKATIDTRSSVPANPDLYMRYWIYLAAPYPTGSVRLDNYTQNVMNGLNLGLSLNDQYLALSDGVSASNPPPLVSTSTLPTNSWHCLELHVGATEIDGWLDGVQPPGFTIPIAVAGQNPPLDHAVFGLSYQTRQMNADTDVWYDDIVIDTKDPGCGPTVVSK